MFKDSSDQALEYTRRLYANVREWYDNADKKAQVILTLDGVFISFLTSSVLLKTDFTNIISNFGMETILLLVLMVFTMSGSVYSALRCLWSRLDPYQSKEVTNQENELKEIKVNGDVLADRMFFFHYVKDLDRDKFRLQLQKVSKEFEIDVLAFQIHALSKNVSKKHTWVNRGFVFLVLSVLLFLFMGLSYVIRIVQPI